MTDLIANRYELKNKIGVGGMGAVYTVRDRLTGRDVALKQVNIPAGDLAFASRFTGSESADLLLALALEFRTLADLRHPNIVSVFDYGFDGNQLPFFTMQLLEGGKTLSDYALGRSYEEKIRLIADVLKALAYLHRRGIIHRDLKPGNVLVDARNHLKVLDFGLAINHRDSISNIQEGIVGTFAYMAPELFNEEDASVQSDLYATGIILYQLLLERHPFNTRNILMLVQSIINTEPDLSEIDESLRPLLAELLAKNPDDRPRSAGETLSRLIEASGFHIAVDDIATRESYLQAARFVGRNAELEYLRTALNNARSDESSSYLLGGESGVGKSRLIEEIRTRALVDGFLVLSGQAVDGVGRPYETWIGVMRHLLITVPVSDADAMILKNFLPDVESLLSRTIPDAPPLSPDVIQARLLDTVYRLFTAQTQPVLIVLEDLQWMREGLELLQRLIKKIDSIPIIILATYRNDERPDLPDLLPEMQTLQLERFDREAVEELGLSMLGDTGKNSSLIDLLHAESEGNVFFMVEIVRALADSAGSLDSISENTNQRGILTGGVQNIVQRRLAKLDEPVREWLKRVAIFGRLLDTDLILHMMHNQISQDDPSAYTPQSLIYEYLARYIQICADAVIFEPESDSWRFAHDKIRETILAMMTDDERRERHRQAAFAIQSVYPDDFNQAERIFEHWIGAGDKQEIATWGLRASNIQKSERHNDRSALAIAERAIKYAPENSMLRAHLLINIGDCARTLRDDKRVIPAYEEALGLVRESGDIKAKIRTLIGLAFFIGDAQYLPEKAQVYAQEAQALADEHFEPGTKFHFMASNTSALIALLLGDLDRAVNYFESNIGYARKAGMFMPLQSALNNLGIVRVNQGDFVTAKQHFLEALHISRKMGHHIAGSYSLSNLGDIALMQGDYALAYDFYTRAHEIYLEHGSASNQIHGYKLRGRVAIHRGDYDTAHEIFERLKEHVISHDGLRMGAYYDYAGVLAIYQNNIEDARWMFAESIKESTQREDTLHHAGTLERWGSAEVWRGNVQSGIELLEKAHELYRSFNIREVTVKMFTVLASAYRRTGNLTAANAIAEIALVQTDSAKFEFLTVQAQLIVVFNAIVTGDDATARQLLKESLVSATKMDSQPLYVLIVLAEAYRRLKAGDSLGALQRMTLAQTQTGFLDFALRTPVLMAEIHEKTGNMTLPGDSTLDLETALEDIRRV